LGAREGRAKGREGVTHLFLGPGAHSVSSETACILWNLRAASDQLGSMQGLQGDFGTMSLKDLVTFLGSRAVTGGLTLEREGVRKQVVLDKGAIVNGSSNLPREYLGQFLINMGHITEEQFARAFETQKETKVYFGQILVMINLVTEDTVKAALELKFKETILDAFNWPVGAFTFDPNAAMPPLGGLEVRVPLLDLLKENDFRQTAWEQIRRVFPTGDCTLDLRPEKLGPRPKPGAIEAKLLKAIEAGQTIDEMGLSLHATDFSFYQRLYAMYRQGALEVLAPAMQLEPDFEAEMGLSDGPTPAQILENAGAFLKQKNFRDAFELARRSNQMSPSLEASQLLKDIEVAWHPVLQRQLVGQNLVPELLITLEAARALPITAPERYLLTRVDGKRSLEAIINVAPLREFETLGLFARFAEQKWIEFSRPPGK
jgi:hypothetical protein